MITITDTKPQSARIPGSDRIMLDSDTFPDETFRKYVAEKFDRNNDGFLDDEELNSVREVNVSGMGIVTLRGIEFFPNLEKLSCASYRGDDELWRENHIEVLDLSYNTKIREVDAGTNCITSINLTNCKRLESLWLYANGVEILDLSDCPNLKELNVQKNWDLKSLDLRKNKLLTELSVESDVKLYR